MHKRLVSPVVVGWALYSALGCAKSTPRAGAAASGKSPSNVPHVVTGNACDRKLLTAADAAAVLNSPVSGSNVIPGDPQSCEFTTTGYSRMTVSLRPALGRTTVSTWKDGRTPVSAMPLAGVGEDAAWVESLHEVVAEKHDLLCDIQVTDVAKELSGSSVAERQGIGALCNKIFAAVQ